MSGDVDYLLAFRTFACMNLSNFNRLAATFAAEPHLGRLRGYDPDSFTLGALDLPA